MAGRDDQSKSEQYTKVDDEVATQRKGRGGGRY